MKLIFVYNADSGLFNAITDTVHKVMSPDTYSCSLCAFTYGMTSMQKNWKSFLESIDHEKAFLHRNELKKAYPTMAETKLPSVFIERNETVSVFVSADEIDASEDLDSLIKLLGQRLEEIE